MKIVDIVIDGKKILAELGSNLLEIALSNGINIPNLCYHKKLTPTAACRLCIVKVEGQKQLLPACTLNVCEGMQITAFDDELEESRRQNIDLLLSEYNYSPEPSKKDLLVELAKRYGLEDTKSRKSFDLTTQIKKVVDDSSPVLSYDSSKCIKCFRCIKGCSEVQGKDVLSFADRGLDSYIMAGTGKWSESECDGCGECVQLCPTGALVEKPNRNILDLEKIDKKVKTICPYCGVGCQICLYIKEGKIVRSDGVEGVMPNDGRLCVKGRFGYEYTHSNERLTMPLIKKDGKFVESSWDEALNLIASKFSEMKEKYGPNSLAGLSSARCTNEDNYIFQKFIRMAFGTNNIDYCTRLCHASTVSAMIKSIGDGAGSNSIQDFEKTECVFVIGNNTIETHPVTATYIKRGKANGHKIIIADPKWTPLVKYADVWLQHKIGSDIALLNAITHVIIREGLFDRDFIKNRVEGGMDAFEGLKKVVEKYTPEYAEKITNVSCLKIEEAARIYASSKSAIIATGMGSSQQVTGTDSVFTLLNMMLISGKIGNELSGMSPPRGQNNVQGATDVGASPVFYPGYISVSNVENRRKVADVWKVPFESLPRDAGLTTVEMVNAAYDGKIKAIYIMGENPLHTDPNLNHTREAFEKLEFVVVQDIFPTLTTELADVILPAADLFEKEGTVVSSDRRVLKINKAVDSPGQARDDWKIIVSIAEKMGANIGTYKNSSEIFDEIAAVTPIMSGLTTVRVEKEEIQWPCDDKNYFGTPTLYLEKFNTETGKAKLFPVEYLQRSEQRSEKYPFILNSGRILYQYHSSTMSRRCESLNSFANESYVLINPYDAKRYYFQDGDLVKVSSVQGELTTKVRVSKEVAMGELFMPWHFEESLVNNLTRSDMDPYSKIAPFKETACNISKL